MAGDHEPANWRLRDGCGHRVKVALGAGVKNVESYPETAGGRLQAARVGRRVGVGWVNEEGNFTRHGDKFVQEF